MRRYLKIENYRNIGINEPQTFNINSHIENDQLGELIIIVGQNNTGKSNLLSAFSSINGKITEDDRPDFIYDSNVLPKITLTVKKDENEKYTFVKTINKSVIKGPDHTEKIKEDKVAFTEADFKFLINILGNTKNQKITDRTISATRISVCTANDIIESIKQDVAICSETLTAAKAMYDRIRTGIQEKSTMLELINKMVDHNEVVKRNGSDTVLKNQTEKQFMEKYGFNLVPKITNYVPVGIKQTDLNASIEKLSTSTFYNKLFRLIKINQEEIRNVYIAYNRNKVADILTEYETKINVKLKGLVQKCGST